MRSGGSALIAEPMETQAPNLPCFAASDPVFPAEESRKILAIGQARPAGLRAWARAGLGGHIFGPGARDRVDLPAALRGRQGRKQPQLALRAGALRALALHLRERADESVTVIEVLDEGQALLTCQTRRCPLCGQIGRRTQVRDELIGEIRIFVLRRRHRFNEGSLAFGPDN